MRHLIGLALAAVALCQPSAAGALSLDRRAKLWTENRGRIPVCFADGARNFPDVKQRVIKALKESWQKHLDIVFTDFDTCDDSGKSRVRLLLKGSTWFAQTHGTGTSTLRSGPMPDCEHAGNADKIEQCRWSMSIGVSTARFVRQPARAHPRIWKAEDEAVLRSLIVHEFGHVLGFVHEQDTERNWRFRQPQDGELLPVPDEEIYCKPAVGKDYLAYQNLTPGFDDISIMIEGYCPAGHRRLETDAWTTGPVWNDARLSPTDISAAQALYGKPVQRVQRQRVK